MLDIDGHRYVLRRRPLAKSAHALMTRRIQTICVTGRVGTAASEGGGGPEPAGDRRDRHPSVACSRRISAQFCTLTDQ
jgi:hypothetical protein